MNWPLLQNSLLLAGTTTAVATGFGFGAALWLATLEARWRNLFLALAVVALALPPFLITNCWISLLGDTGVWRGWLPFRIYSLGGTIWILSLMLWPITALLTLSGWRRLEAAQLECDPALTGFALVRVLLVPLARGELTLAALVTFVLALNNFAVPAILQTRVLPDEMWIRFNTVFDTLGALKASLPLVIVPLVLLVLFWRRGIAWPRVQGAVATRIFQRQLGTGWVWSCGVLTLVVCVLSVGLPLAQIALAHRTWTELPGALAAGQGAVWNSVWLAVGAATAVVAVSLLVWNSGFSRSGPPKGGTPNFGMVWLPFFFPGVLLGIGLIWLFNRRPFLGFYRSAGIVVLAFMIRYLALGWSGARHALRATDRDLTDAAKLEGATGWQMLRHVLWPQIGPQILAAWYVIYLLCLWDVESMILVVPPGGETLALRIFNLLHYGHNAQVNALCLTLLGLAVAPLVVVAALGRARLIFTSRKDGGFLPKAATAGLAIALFAGCAPQATTNEAALESKIFSRVEIIGVRGVGIGEFNKPRSVAVDRQDNLYAVDMTGRVQKFSPEGKFLLSWQMPLTDMGKPKGMCCDRDGNIVVVEPHYSRVNHFSPEGTLVRQWGVRGTNAGEFMLPRAVAVNSRGEIFVSEYTARERVQRFLVKDEGRRMKDEIREIGSNDRPQPGALPQERIPQNHSRPEPLNPWLDPSKSQSGAEAARTPDADARYAATTAARSVWSAGGFSAAFSEPDRRSALRFMERENPSPSRASSVVPRLLDVVGKAGTGPGEFNRPEGICVDAQDRLYVADSCNHRIQVFSSDGKFIRAYGRAGTGKGELSYPYDITVDADGNQFVCEFGNSRIQIFDANDRPIEIIGGPGAEPGRFANPWGVALDSHGNLYVADSQNHRVQKLVKRMGQIGRMGPMEATSMNAISRITHNASR